MSRRSASDWCGMSLRTRPPVSPSTCLAQSRATLLQRSRRAKGSLGSSSSIPTGAAKALSTAVCHSERFRAQFFIFRRIGRHRLSVGGIASMPDICSVILTPL